LARKLRHYLKVAGVDREELHETTETSQAIVFHGLRATGITWQAVRGDDPLKIKRRAGHASFTTTEIYIREAENLGAGFGTGFPPLPASILAGPRVGRDWAMDSPIPAFLAASVVGPTGFEPTTPTVSK
jgi:hypothetical protein